MKSAWDVLDIFEKMIMNEFRCEYEYQASTKTVTISNFFSEVDDMTKLKFVQAIAWTMSSFVLDDDEFGEHLLIRL